MRAVLSSVRRKLLLALIPLTVALTFVTFPSVCFAQTPAAAATRSSSGRAIKSAKPKLVVILVVDQMRADYVEKFGQQWTGGLHRLVDEGAWFREAAYRYAATETCVGHSTISTGALPSSHGMIGNEWFNRDTQKTMTCTEDPKVKDVGYAGVVVKGGDSAANMLLPAFSNELKFQSGSGTRVVTFSLKARAAITLGGTNADAVTWYDVNTGGWQTSSAYPVAPFVEDFAKAHPVAADYGKTWTAMLPASAYLYDSTAVGAKYAAESGPSLPHPLHGAAGSTAADKLFYLQWQASPYADTYLVNMADDAVDQLGLGQRGGTDFLGVSFSSPDYVGHAFGPRSWEIQDVLAQLDRDLGVFFAHLDQRVGRGNYVVALTADHGVAPIPDDMAKAGMPAGWFNVEEVKTAVSGALAANGYGKDDVKAVMGSDIYFAPGVYQKVQADGRTLDAVITAILNVPGVANVYTAEQLENPPTMQNNIFTAEANSFLRSRSGDLLVVPQPFFPWDFSTATKPRMYGATHGSPYYYDQHVPILFMGYGIEAGEYFGPAAPADIAPTLAALCGITLSTRDGHVLAQAIAKQGAVRGGRTRLNAGAGAGAKP
jgi:predicted AlkP superfamily pyrophosphatase or phosphodiesterase